MKRTEFTYPSSNGRSTIHGCLWEPEDKPKAVIQIAHGITEHILRYEELAAFFTARGYAVAGNDHLGHGTSWDPDGPRPTYFGPKGSWKYVVADIRACSDRLRQQYPDTPLCLMGFSLGSFAVRCLVGDAPDAADLTIWAGTGQLSSAEIAAARFVVNLEGRRFGETSGTPLLHKLTMGAYNQHFKPCRTRSDWLCATPEAVDAYLADPLCGEGFTVSSFRELLTGMEISRRDSHVAKMNRQLPVLLIAGTQDPVGNFGKGLELVRRQLQKQGVRDVTVACFDQMRHDIFREADKDLVFARIDSWLRERL